MNTGEFLSRTGLTYREQESRLREKSITNPININGRLVFSDNDVLAVLEHLKKTSPSSEFETPKPNSVLDLTNPAPEKHLATKEDLFKLSEKFKNYLGTKVMPEIKKIAQLSNRLLMVEDSAKLVINIVKQHKQLIDSHQEQIDEHERLHAEHQQELSDLREIIDSLQYRLEKFETSNANLKHAPVVEEPVEVLSWDEDAPTVQNPVKPSEEDVELRWDDEDGPPVTPSPQPELPPKNPPGTDPRLFTNGKFDLMKASRLALPLNDIELRYYNAVMFPEDEEETV